MRKCERNGENINLLREEIHRATTRLMTRHTGNGMTIMETLKDGIDYGKNPDKTRNGHLILAYECDPTTADAEFLLGPKWQGLGLALVSVLLKSDLGQYQGLLPQNISLRRQKIAMHIITLTLVAGTTISMYFLYMLFQSLFSQLSVHQADAILEMGIAAVSMFVFAISMFLIPAILYTGKNNNALISIPLRPQVIAGGNLSVCIIYFSILSAVMLLPFLIAYGQHVAEPFTFYIFAILITLTLPIYPALLYGILIMLGMSFAPLAKKRGRYNVIAIFIVIMFAFF